MRSIRTINWPRRSSRSMDSAAFPRNMTGAILPREDVGEGVVLRTGPNSSTVLITFSLREIYPGDYVEARIAALAAGFDFSFRGGVISRIRFAENFRRESLDSYFRILPSVPVESRFHARFFQQAPAVPTELRSHLRQQNPSLGAPGHHQAVLARLNLLGRNCFER